MIWSSTRFLETSTFVRWSYRNPGRSRAKCEEQQQNKMSKVILSPGNHKQGHVLVWTNVKVIELLQ